MKTYGMDYLISQELANSFSQKNLDNENFVHPHYG